MRTIKNTAPGPRGVELMSGEIVYLEPRQTLELDVDLKATLYEGLKDAGDSEDEAGGKPISNEDIVSAVALLDQANDEHWTNAGLPSVEAVSEALGGAVTRAQIKAAAPDAKRATTA